MIVAATAAVAVDANQRTRRLSPHNDRRRLDRLGVQRRTRTCRCERRAPRRRERRNQLQHNPVDQLKPKSEPLSRQQNCVTRNSSYTIVLAANKAARKCCLRTNCAAAAAAEFRGICGAPLRRLGPRAASRHRCHRTPTCGERRVDRDQ